MIFDEEVKDELTNEDDEDVEPSSKRRKGDKGKNQVTKGEDVVRY